jgi:hypothetical protein
VLKKDVLNTVNARLKSKRCTAAPTQFFPTNNNNRGNWKSVYFVNDAGIGKEQDAMEESGDDSADAGTADDVRLRISRNDRLPTRCDRDVLVLQYNPDHDQREGGDCLFSKINVVFCNTNHRKKNTSL